MILQGYSGSELNVLVHKSGKNSTKQKAKHNYFEMLELQSFKVPKLYLPVEEYMYTYVDGINSLEALIDGVLDIKVFADKVNAIIKELASHSSCSIDVFKFNTSSECVFNKLIANGIDNRLAGKIAGNIKLPITLSHGDLTFDNILLSNTDCDDVYLLDYHPLFYPSYYLDVAKLFQDIDGNWPEIKYGKIIPEYYKLQLRGFIWDSLPEDYKMQHSALMVVSFARILPYAKNERDKKLITMEIERFAGEVK